MTFRRIASWPSWLAVALLPVLAHCDPADEARPPVTAAAVASPDGERPTAPDPEESAAATYASDEFAIGADPDSYDDNDPAALTDFHKTLDPHGSWVDDRTYGTVWVPSTAAVGADFRPYATAGHWTYEDDWVWASDFDWGWAPFHYGRWVWIEGRGWSWSPGRTYRGAWVVWSVDDGYGYMGWAPAPLAFVWFGGVAVRYPVYVAPRWVYCARGDVFSPALGGRVIAGPAAAPIAARMRLYVPAVPGVAAGPPPQRLGYLPAQIPHAGGVDGAGLRQAQQFSRPSTALPLGAQLPSRLPPATATVSHSPGTVPWTTRPVAGAAVAPRGSGIDPRGSGIERIRPSSPGVDRAPAAAMPQRAAPMPAPIVRAPAPASRAPSFSPAFHSAPPAFRSSGVPGGGAHHR